MICSSKLDIFVVTTVWSVFNYVADLFNPISASYVIEQLLSETYQAKYWMSPDGKLESIGVCKHGEYACHYYLRNDPEIKPDWACPIMYGRGYLRIVVSDHSVFYDYDEDVNKPTSDQIRVLKDMSIERKADLVDGYNGRVIYFDNL